ncbi:hypothetical protein SAMN06265222_12359 [Neorhodopirellula lusitana]|uniref:Uncharacterized protein n=1 Tax=Neorhodopirellula lusitana TaxID=445327 RepID=A0ABY1QSA4_9BACT|nr:hypothetical protein SAMN06265222_12359 [Neorhodopirellula lusitana]
MGDVAVGGEQGWFIDVRVLRLGWPCSAPISCTLLVRAPALPCPALPRPALAWPGLAWPGPF